MPLPNSGVGGTLTGEKPVAAGAPDADRREPAAPAQELRTAVKGRAALQQTLLGMAPGLTAGPAHAVPAVPAGLVKPPPAGAKSAAAEPQAVAVPAVRPADLGNRTLIGIPPGALPPLDPKRPKAPVTTPQGAPVAARPPATATKEEAARAAGFEPVRATATILGSTAPIDVPGRASASAEIEATRAEGALPDHVPEQPAARALERTALAPLEGTAVLPNEAVAPPPGQIKTHLGVAIPGIAPLRPGVSGAPPAVPAAPPRPAIEATQLQPQASTMTLMGGRPQMPRSALVLLISGLVLLLSAGAFALLWKASSPLSAVVSADPSGKDRIDVVCETCPDGTRLSLGQTSTEVRERKAYLVLPEALPLGESTLAFGFQQPGEDAETIEVTLPPVEYRIKPDTSTLVGDQPRVTLDIHALPGSSVNIGGKAVSLDAAGRGQIAIDAAERLTGPASEVVSFEQAIAYSIQPPSGKSYEGELRVKIGVTPLILEAPGTDTVTDMERFMLAGRTMKASEVWVAGASISVDGSGRFAQLMSIDSVGETKVTVRASAPGLAPRFAAFRLRRVKDLRAELDTLSRSALPLSRVAANPDAKIDSQVLVRGKVQEARVDGQRTFVIVASEDPCDGGFCLARLVYGGLRKLERGMSVTAVGRLLGGVGAAGAERVPEIEVTLLQ